ncbi:MAG TPA: hypothetical protein VL443_21390 [Cyclobacteriaceae bacterium]|nr:hypothetical protein [Cyclobacteriaceae bacterium]
MNLTQQNKRKRTRMMMTVMMATLSIICAYKSNAQSTDNKKSIHVGLIYPISNHGARAGEYTNVFSLNGIAGVSHEETSVSVAGVTNVIKENGSGVQIAGVSNHIHKKAEGAQIAGMINTYETANGTQIAGFGNIASDSVEGTQIAGFINTAGSINGFQLGGFINTANYVDGIQTAGFINIAKKVKGVQLAGFINIADSSEYPIGIINIISNGEQSISVTTDETLTTLVSFRSGSRKLYGILGIGANFKNSTDAFALEAGIGANLLNKPSFRLSAEAVTITLTGFNGGGYQRNSLRIMPSVKVTDRIELFGGPTLSYVQTNTKDGRELMKHSIWDNGHHDLRGFTAGATGGVRYLLK